MYFIYTLLWTPIFVFFLSSVSHGFSFPKSLWIRLVVYSLCRLFEESSILIISIYTSTSLSHMFFLIKKVTCYTGTLISKKIENTNRYIAYPEQTWSITWGSLNEWANHKRGRKRFRKWKKITVTEKSVNLIIQLRIETSIGSKAEIKLVLLYIPM